MYQCWAMYHLCARGQIYLELLGFISNVLAITRHVSVLGQMPDVPSAQESASMKPQSSRPSA